MNDSDRINNLNRKLERAERNFELSKIIMDRLEVAHRKLQEDFKHLVLAHNAVLEENIKLKGEK